MRSSGQENEDLKASLKELEARLDEYSRMELTIVDTLETAKRTTENLRAVAEREREAILEEAWARADISSNGPGRGPRKQSPV